MTTKLKNKEAALKNQTGFTLIEMLIVVIVLGILAMIIIPQITVSTEDAKLATLQTNLNTMRNAIELYYHQHNQIYPGAKDTDGSTALWTAGNETAAAIAFIAQLTTYTEASGKAAGDSRNLTAPIYGPYIKTVTLPKNPFTDTVDLTCDTDETDVTERTADTAGTKAWKFYVKTGVFIANDSTAHEAY